MRTTTLIVALLTGLSVTVLIGGCPPPPEQPGPTGPTPGPTVSGDKVKIKLLAMEYDTNTKPFMEKLEEGFNRDTPDVELTVEVVDWNTGKDKLSTQLAAGAAPDLVNIATIWLPEFVDLDVVEPLDSYVSEEFRGKFIPMTLRGAEYEGKLYGLPIAVSARALYYNKALLDAAEEQAPKSWDDLVRIAKKVHKPDQGVSGFGVQGAKVETDVYFYYFLWANGGEILSADGESAVFNGPEGVEALQFVCDLVSKHKVSEPNPTAYDREGLQDIFKAGKLAMMITGPWFWGHLDEQAPDLDYGIAPIPANRKQVTMAVTDNMVMMKHCKDKQAAWKFVEYFYKPELREEWAQTFGMLPELKSVAESEFITTSTQWTTFMELLPTGKFVPLHPRWTAIADEIVTGVQQALMGQKTPKEALDGAAERVNKVIAEG